MTSQRVVVLGVAEEHAEDVKGLDGAGGLADAGVVDAPFPDRQRVAEILLARFGQEIVVQFGEDFRQEGFEPLQGGGRRRRCSQVSYYLCA